jgi:hypothetical protein
MFFETVPDARSPPSRARNRYAQSLSALSHLILLAPHNPYHLLRHAETAYTLADFPLAYKEFLRVVEMSEGVSASGGVGRRAAMGAKLVRLCICSGTRDKLTRSRSASPE